MQNWNTLNTNRFFDFKQDRDQAVTSFPCWIMESDYNEKQSINVNANMFPNSSKLSV